MLFTLERKDVLSVARPLLFFFVVVFFAYVKLMSIVFRSFDPFVPFENLTAALFFGGIMDAVKRAKKSATQRPTKDAATAAAAAAAAAAGGGASSGVNDAGVKSPLSELESKKNS